MKSLTINWALYGQGGEILIPMRGKHQSRAPAQVWSWKRAAVSLLCLSLLGFMGSLVWRGLWTRSVLGEYQSGSQLAELLHPDTADGSWLIGEELASELLKRRYLLVGFWSMEQTASSILHQSLQEIPSDSKEFGVVSVVTDSQHPSLPQAMLKLLMRQYFVTHVVYFDSNYSVWRLLGASELPSLMLFDQASGQILKKWSLDAMQSLASGKFREALQQVLLEQREQSQELTVEVGDRNEEPARVDLRSTAFGSDLVAQDIALGKASVFIADPRSNRVLVVDRKTHHVTQVGGEPGQTDGSFAKMRMRAPSQLAWSENLKSLFVADWVNHTVVQLDFRDQSARVVLSEEGFAPGDLALLENGLVILSLSGSEFRYYPFSADGLAETTFVSSFERMGLGIGFLADSLVASRKFRSIYFLDRLNQKLAVFDFGQETFRELKTLDHRAGVAREDYVLLEDETLSSLSFDTDLHMVSYDLNWDQVRVQTLGLGFGPLTLLAADPRRRNLVLFDPVTHRLCSLDSIEKFNPECTVLQITNSQKKYVNLSPLNQVLQMKAATPARVELSFKAPHGYFFSDRDVHLVELPDGGLSRWWPDVPNILRFQTPDLTGNPQSGKQPLKASLILCDSKTMEACRVSFEEWEVSPRESFGRAAAEIQKRL